MNKNLQELIEAADNLCKTLDKAAADEKQFCYDTCYQLEIMQRETYKIAQNLKNIKERLY